MLEGVKTLLGITGGDLDKYITVGLLIVSMFFIMALLNIFVKTVDTLINK